jgi:hypothetical protein
MSLHANLKLHAAAVALVGHLRPIWLMCCVTFVCEAEMWLVQALERIQRGLNLMMQLYHMYEEGRTTDSHVDN